MSKLKVLGLAVVIIAAIWFMMSGKKDTAEIAAAQPVYIGQTNIMGAVEPTNDGTPWSLTSHGISETLYKLDESGNIVTRMVENLEQIDALNWKVTLKQDIFFSDGSKIDAQAVSASMNQIIKENELSRSTVGIMVFTPIDNVTFTINTERTTMLMQSVLTEWTNIIFKQLNNGQYIFTGPYVIEHLDPGVQLKLTPNKYYPDANKRSDVVIKAFKDTSAMQLAFQSGELDMAFTITPDMAEILKSQGHIVKSIDAGYQYFNIINLKHPTFDDQNIRQALNYSIDRGAMVQALRGGRPATGFFAHYYSFAGHSNPEYSPEKADALLDKAGWIKNNAGIRVKNGKTLKIKLATYPTRPDLVLLMQIIASQLKDRGIECTTELVDGIDAYARKGNFDILVYAQHTAPTADPAFALNQFFRTDGTKNFNGYSSKTVDNLLDKMGKMTQNAERDKLAIEVQEQIFKDLPVIYLIDPQWHIAVSPRLKDYTPYGGDYYVVNDRLMAE